MRRSKKRTWPDDLEVQIGHLERLSDAAEASGSWVAATNARSRVVELRRELARLRDEAAADDEDSLARVSRLRRRAAEEGSWIAAARLHREERELQAEREARERAEREESGEGLSQEQLVADLVGALRGLPEALRAEVLRAASALPASEPEAGDDEEG